MGDMGREAYRFVDLIAGTGLGLWQLMPLGPTGFGDSPYACFSAFAGNPLLISPERLREEGLLSESDLAQSPGFPEDRVDFGPVIQFRKELLRRAWCNFKSQATEGQRGDFEDFCRACASWLDDFALFMALKEVHQTVWNVWEKDLVRRKPAALHRAAKKYSDLVQSQKFAQYLFFKQWKALKQYANDLGIRIIGDIPIFVAHDSADVWAHPEFFQLDDDRAPTVVAGVPPDYFSKTGQLWGNPLYRWDVMAHEGFQWWVERLCANLEMLDIIRLDHFRGFEAYWEVQASEKTAINGRWVKAPGDALFRTLCAKIGDVPIIAEDLGIITPPVEELRDAFGFPGMKVLQFAFGDDPDNKYLPHNFIPNCAVYTGTHDNDTTLGWYRHSSTENERDFVRRYLATDGREIHWDMIRLAFSSVAHTAVIPLQDVLGLGSKARMNYPGKASGNWAWRFREGQLTSDILHRLAELLRLYSRRKKEKVAGERR
jgi:4-alpha-glucanotransferase